MTVTGALGSVHTMSPPTTRPPSPGPAPTKPEFPFEEAEAAKTALSNLQTELYGLITTRDAAASSMLAGSSGSSIDAFQTRYDELDGEIRATCAYRGASLVADIEWIAEAIRLAQEREDEYQLAKAEWDTAAADFRQWMELTDNGRNVPY